MSPGAANRKGLSMRVYRHKILIDGGTLCISNIDFDMDMIGALCDQSWNGCIAPIGGECLGIFNTSALKSNKIFEDCLHV